MIGTWSSSGAAKLLCQDHFQSANSSGLACSFACIRAAMSDTRSSTLAFTRSGSPNSFTCSDTKSVERTDVSLMTAEWQTIRGGGVTKPKVLSAWPSATRLLTLSLPSWVLCSGEALPDEPRNNHFHSLERADLFPRLVEGDMVHMQQLLVIHERDLVRGHRLGAERPRVVV